MESAILLLRDEYLTKMKAYREEKRFICYLDETWYDTHDTIKKGWDDSTGMCSINVPVSRGKRIIIAHAGSMDGWVGEALLSAKNIKSSSLDYHEDMTSSLFEDWFVKKLLPALPPKSILESPYFFENLDSTGRASTEKDLELVP
ncbi:monocarboxylate transporter [Holotrichia oblita]|uniref:Monocarboxylate transporter n=1 Tax=Holotrichia oblita TaxID=644536 RepID=A0ACB9SUZ0_HOLOL|nr:monocarboxylate transporter [Holotrichia oblita]